MVLTSEKIEETRILTNTTQIRNVAEQHIQRKAAADDFQKSLSILEAGCGREWTLDLGPVQYKLTGVDLDAHALDFRKNKIKDLDEAIVGDLCTVQLDSNTYDVIFNAYVLEHIKEADLVLKKFSQWLKAEGLLILLFPDRNSVYGFLTQITPHWIHVLYQRYLAPWNNKNAGEKGFGPYPTYHASVVSRAGIQEFCQANNFFIEAEYASNTYIEQSSGFKALLIRSIVNTVYVLSFGKLEPRYNNLIYVLKKKC